MTGPRTSLALSAALLLLGSCTLTGLSDYPVTSCNPNATSYAEDDCRTLDGPAAGCWRHRCNPTGHCDVVFADDDHDGDPAATCGGGDCDDTTPLRNSRFHEICDGIDNDCNGVVDDGLLEYGYLGGTGIPNLMGITAISRGVVSTAVTSLVGQPDGSSCIHVTALPSDPFQVACTLLGGAGLSIAQPFASASLQGAIGVFVEPTACGGFGRLGFRNTAGMGGELPCGAASFPSFAAHPDGSYGVVVLSNAPLDPITEPDEDCRAVSPSALTAVWLHDPYGMNAGFDETAPSLTTTARVTRPLGIIPAFGDAVLVGAPDADGVSIWELVAPSLMAHASVVEVAHLVGPAFAGATDVAMWLRTDVSPDTTPDNMAVLVQRGCTPGELSLVVGQFTTFDQFLPRVTIGVPSAPSTSRRRLSTLAYVSAGPLHEWRALFAEGYGEEMLRAVPVGDVPGIATQSGYAVAPLQTVPAFPPVASLAGDGTAVAAGPNDPAFPSQQIVANGPLRCQ
jgi:hypothetical protein